MYDAVTPRLAEIIYDAVTAVLAETDVREILAVGTYEAVIAKLDETALDADRV